MRFLINRLPALGRKTGVGRYTADLIAGLPALLGPGEELDCFPDGWFGRACAWLRAVPGPAGWSGGGSAKPTWRGWLKGHLVRAGHRFLDARFAAHVRRRRPAVYHEPNNVPRPCDVPTIATLHDLSVLLYPQWHPAGRVARWEESFRKGLAQCAHVLTDTAAVRSEIVRHLGVPPDKVTATPLGINPAMRPVPETDVQARLKALGLPPRYLLCVGTLEPRKNQLLLLRAYVALPAALRERFPLLLVGGLGWHTAELTTFLHDEGRPAGVLHVGYLADADLPVLYSGARALLFPSHYEGFGLPPLEMQACGGAVLASTAAALREVLAGSPAELLDPDDADGWHAALARVCTDDDWWRGLRVGAEAAAARFTWARCAAQTLAVYRQVAGVASPLRLSA